MARNRVEIMRTQIEILHIWTKDNLRLQGIYYKPETTNICVLFIHGMSGNFIENYFAHILGKYLAENNVAFIYSHNRGYNHINDIATKEIVENGGYKTVRIGAMYERFLESEYDIEGWVNECKKNGYKQIILLGHSLGCNKTIHFYYKQKPSSVVGIILASPPDMVGLAELPRYQVNYRQLLTEAKKNIKENQPRKTLSKQIWGWYELSSQTFLDLFEENGPADNLPVLRNPDSFSELASVSVPILGIMGESDDIEIRTLKEDLDLIATKAVNCPSFAKKFIPAANHTYDKQEKSFANTILEWIKTNY